MTLHNNFSSVFAYFPDRVDMDVDGYIATKDCSEMGEIREIYVKDEWFTVKIADCLAGGDFVGQNWLLDLDYRIWRYKRVPTRPETVIMCKRRPE